MTEDHNARTPRINRVAVWLLLTNLRIVGVFGYAAAAVFPGGPPVFGPEAPDFSKLLDPRVSHKEVFDGDE